MQRRTIVILLGLAAIVLIAAGCGGSGDSGGGASTSSTSNASDTDGSTASADSTTDSSADSTTDSSADSTTDSTSAAAPLTKAEFVKQGDAICGKVPAEFKVKLEALQKGAKSKPSAEEVAMKATLPPLRTASEGLKELGVPSGDEQQVSAIVAALDEAADTVEEKPESELSGPKSPFATFTKLSTAYGFKVCPQL